MSIESAVAADFVVSVGAAEMSVADVKDREVVAGMAGPVIVAGVKVALAVQVGIVAMERVGLKWAILAVSGEKRKRVGIAAAMTSIKIGTN